MLIKLCGDPVLIDMSLFFFCALVLTKVYGGRYHQAGTPKLEVSTSYDSSAHTYTIQTKQNTPTSSNAGMQPVMLPLAVALFDTEGHEMSLKLKVSVIGTLSLWCVMDCTNYTHLHVFCTSFGPLPSQLFPCLVFTVCLFMLEHCTLHACCLEAHFICANALSTSQQWSGI